MIYAPTPLSFTEWYCIRIRVIVQYRRHSPVHILHYKLSNPSMSQPSNVRKQNQKWANNRKWDSDGNNDKVRLIYLGNRRTMFIIFSFCDMDFWFLNATAAVTNLYKVKWHGFTLPSKDNGAWSHYMHPNMNS